jgi:hypothetical protein
VAPVIADATAVNTAVNGDNTVNRANTVDEDVNEDNTVNNTDVASLATTSI